MKSSFWIDNNRDNAIKACLIVNTAALAIASAILFFFTWKDVFIAESKYTSNEPSKRDFCTMVMDQMIHKKLSAKLVEDALFELVTKDKYATLLLSGNEKITGTWSKSDSCKVMISGETLRSFDFYLEEEGGYPFFYKVRKITENELFGEEANQEEE